MADILIVIIGGGLSGIMIFAGSFMALIIKTFGIDFVISVIRKNANKYSSYKTVSV